jgi:hypothetical protein
VRSSRPVARPGACARARGGTGARPGARADAGTGGGGGRRGAARRSWPGCGGLASSTAWPSPHRLAVAELHRLAVAEPHRPAVAELHRLAVARLLHQPAAAEPAPPGRGRACTGPPWSSRTGRRGRPAPPGRGRAAPARGGLAAAPARGGPAAAPPGGGRAAPARRGARSFLISHARRQGSRNIRGLSRAESVPQSAAGQKPFRPSHG